MRSADPLGGAWAAIWCVHFRFRHRQGHMWLSCLLKYLEHFDILRLLEGYFLEKKKDIQKISNWWQSG